MHRQWSGSKRSNPGLPKTQSVGGNSGKEDAVTIEAKIESFDELEAEIGKMPDQSCPHIDKVIRSLAKAEKTLNSADKNDEPEGLLEIISDAESELWDLDSELEEVRSINEGLRDHAEFWKKKCEAALAYLESRENK
jgi:predicted  nucleic acid-binding Zn-ribbon protein